MSKKLIKVRLILADRVKKELTLLDKAESDRNCKSKVKAIAVAKRLVRESIMVQAMPDGDSIRNVGPLVLQVYKDILRDVGENTFVFDAKTMKAVCVQLSILVNQSKTK